MPSSKEYLDFVLDGCEALSARAMMGEYVLYYGGKVVGGVYDNRLLVKPTKSAVELLSNAPRELPYDGAKEGLAAAHQFADVAMVSSANRDAVEEEWGKFGLLEHTDIVLAQDIGSKAACIAEMLKFGYDPAKVVMIGDAPGDCDAAEKNGVHYFPILVNHEKESWDEAVAVAYGMLQSGEYDAYGAEKKTAFLKNLGA